MRELVPTLEAWRKDGHRFALAIVTQTWGSSPRPLGSAMGVRDDGAVCGSVSGGCVEGAVIEASRAAIADGKPRELAFEGAGGDLWEVGLSCGGRIQVWIDPNPVERDPAVWNETVERSAANLDLVTAVSIDPPETRHWIPDSGQIRDPLDREMQAAFARRTSGEATFDGRRWFIRVQATRDRMLIVGAVHIAGPLVLFARELGFETVIVDPRAAFAAQSRGGPEPDRTLIAWPHAAFDEIGLSESTYAVVLTHDPKIDDAALAILVRSPVAYIGALGSRSTHAKRLTDLAARGLSEAELSRIHGPIGLNIGSQSPQEIALSIVAQVVQTRNRRKTAVREQADQVRMP